MKNITYILLVLFVQVNTIAVTISKNCGANKESVNSQFIDAKNSMKDMLKDVESIIENRSLENFELKRFRQSKRILRCSLFRLETTRFSCSNKKPNSIAFTLKWIGVSVWATDSYFKYSYNEQVGFLIHEITHKCGTNDEEYFWSFSPRDVNNKKWSSIADTYRWWHINGVCIPGVDCD